MQLPDRNVRPIEFLKSLHSSPPVPTGRQSRPRAGQAGTGRDILQHFRNIKAEGEWFNDFSNCTILQYGNLGNPFEKPSSYESLCH
jgi:hypothetical protein